MICEHRSTGARAWTITEWRCNPDGGWALQPIIAVEGGTWCRPRDPQEAINFIAALHADPEMEPKPYHVLMGQLQDALEQFWKPLPVAHNPTKASRNGKVK